MTQTAADALRAAVRRLKPVLGTQASRDTRVLLADALGVELGRLTLVLPEPISPNQSTVFQSHLARRITRQPVSQIIGRRLFWGREFMVTRDVLDPRPETELLIDLVMQGTAPKTVLDLGTGSGCILLTLLAEFSDAEGVGTDISAPALEVAQQNAIALGLAARTRLTNSSWFDTVKGQFDLIVCNPPYITEHEMLGLEPEVAEWEPRQALTPEGDGLDAYRRIAAQLSQHLTPGGRAGFELGKDQGEAVTGLFRDQGFDNLTLHQDLNGHDRVVVVQS